MSKSWKDALREKHDQESMEMAYNFRCIVCGGPSYHPGLKETCSYECEKLYMEG